jgi:hypothetical protein
MNMKKVVLKENIKKVVVVTGRSESGDDYGPWVFDKRPSEKFMEAFLREYSPCEFLDDEDYENYEDEGPGDFGSTVYLTYNECIILNHKDNPSEVIEMLSEDD